MKKTYKQPRATLIEWRTEGMMALSLEIKTDGSGGDQMLSGERGWSSENWSNTSDDDYAE